MLYYENKDNKFVFSFSKQLSAYGIKSGLTLSFVKKLTDNFFPLMVDQFVQEREEIKQSIQSKIQEYSFSMFELPYLTANPGHFDSYSLIADFSGCQLLYKPIFLSLDLIFKSLVKKLKSIPFSFFTSDSFSFSLFCPSSLIFQLNKNLSVTFFNSKQFLRCIKLSTILSPLSLFEESGIFYFSDLIQLPIELQDEILNLAIYSSPLSSRIKLANRFKPLFVPFASFQNFENLDLFMFKIMQNLFNSKKNKKYEIQIFLSPPTNDKNIISSEIRKKLYLESYFLRKYLSFSKTQTIFAVVEYSNQSIDRFGLHNDAKDVLSFFNSVAQQILLKLKGKSALCQIIIEFDKNSCDELFENNEYFENEKLLLLFDKLTKKFGEKKIHLAG